MRRFVPAVLAVFLITIPSLALAQGKVTRDPNKAGVKAVKMEVDARLQKKITYYSGYKRLHDITDDLTRMSGVNILSGKNKEDWHVKDIPLVICVKDMPLGDLLKNIATASHTYLGSEKIGKDDPEKSYRIYRRSVDEAKIDSYFENRRKTSLAQVKWQWDAMAAYGKSPAVDGVPKNIWYLSKVISPLGDSGWDKLQNGQVLRMSEEQTADVAKQGFGELYNYAWDEVSGWLIQDQKFVDDQAAEDSLKRARLEIKFTDKGDSGKAGLTACLAPISINVQQKRPDGTSYNYTQSRQWNYSPPDVLQLNGKLPGLEPYPESVVPPSLEEDMGNPDMLYLNSTRGAQWPEALDKKIDIEKPAEAKDVMFVEFIRQLADVSGLNIITEDFKDQYTADLRGVERWFAKDTTIADTLRRMGTSGWAGCEWFLCEKQNLLLGWADDKGQDTYGDITAYCSTWRHHQRNLVSEAYLNAIRQKLNGDGLSLDDGVALMALSDGSFREWINHTDLEYLNQTARGADSGWWMLYNALTPADKQLAKTTGLALGKFDTDWIASFFRAQHLQEDYMLVYGSAEGDPKGSASMPLDDKTRAMSDPNVISTMVMRLVQKPATERMVVEKDANGMITSGRMQPFPPALKLCTCEMEISYQMDGTMHSLGISYPGNARFAIYSPEREAQIIEAAKEAEKKSARSE